MQAEFAQKQSNESNAKLANSKTVGSQPVVGNGIQKTVGSQPVVGSQMQNLQIQRPHVQNSEQKQSNDDDEDHQIPEQNQSNDDDADHQIPEQKQSMMMMMMTHLVAKRPKSA
eukprot:438146_1